MIGSISPWFIEEFSRRIQSRGAEKLNEMSQGMCADYAHYKEVCGQIAGLNEAIEIADEIRREQDQG